MALTKTPIELSSTPGIVDNSNATAITIDSSENVGIGCSPSYPLTVDTGAGTFSVRAKGGGSVTIASDASLAYFASTHEFYDAAGTSERMRIDSAGNLLVGTTDNTLYNNTSGSGIMLAASGRIDVARVQDVCAILNRTGASDGSIMDLKKNGTTVGSIGTVNGDMYLGTGDTGLFFSDGANYIMPYNVSTPGLADGLLDLGRDTNRFKDLYLSGGVYLGGTGAANKLDSYEEGTWTPTIIGGTTSTTFSGRYTKIGRMVYANFYSGGFAITNASGIASIGGLPFTVKSTGDGYGASATFTHVTCFSAAIQTGYCNAGGNVVYPTPAQSSATTTFINSSLVYIMMSVAYEAA